MAYVIVSEAGASVYSASKLAAKEFPEYDVSLRSAVSIARRMQDPLAELVKIDPKAIGVGQYQHDLKQAELENALSGVVESCVSSVGVDVETASASLLTHVRASAKRWPTTLWPIGTKMALPRAPSSKRCRSWGRKRLNSARASCASTAAIRWTRRRFTRKLCGGKSADGEAGLCAAGIERGGIVGILTKAEQAGMAKLAAELGVGEMTLRDIASELEKPGRDPRDELPRRAAHGCAQHGGFEARHGTDGHGAQRHRFRRVCGYRRASDGLVHISRMADKFIQVIRARWCVSATW